MKKIIVLLLSVFIVIIPIFGQSVSVRKTIQVQNAQERERQRGVWEKDDNQRFGKNNHTPTIHTINHLPPTPPHFTQDSKGLEVLKKSKPSTPKVNNNKVPKTTINTEQLFLKPNQTKELDSFSQSFFNIRPTLLEQLSEEAKTMTPVKKITKEKIQERLLSYIQIESQSIDDPDMASFPMTEGQKEMAKHIYDEVLSFKSDDVKVTMSDDYYVYIDIPSNIKEAVPSIMFMAHLDVTPEAPGIGIKPIIHENYDGGDIELPAGIVLSPNTPQGSHLKDLIGKTIVTSDGSTLLGADDKTGCAVLVTMIEEIINNPEFRHGRIMVTLSQNEDVGKAAMRYDPNVFDEKPDIVIDLDGDTYNQFSVANFTAIGQSYLFKGNKAHASNGKQTQYADALTAASYFIGLVPPEMNPSAREGEEGYIHCYSMMQPDNNSNDYVVKVRLRFFDKNEGKYQRQLMEDNLVKTQKAFPFVKASIIGDDIQYENIAYTMPDYVPRIIEEAAVMEGLFMSPKKSRGGTTSAMMVAHFPNEVPGGSDLYSGQNAEHSCYEWCCVEELMQMVNVAEHIINLVLTITK